MIIDINVQAALKNDAERNFVKECFAALLPANTLATCLRINRKSKGWGSTSTFHAKAEVRNGIKNIVVNIYNVNMMKVTEEIASIVKFAESERIMTWFAKY